MLRIVTNATADLPTDLTDSNNIYVLPNWIHLKSGKVRTDAVTAQYGSANWYDLLSNEPDIPRTEPLSEEEYFNEFERVLEPDHSLIFISISSKISPMYEIAHQAAQRFPQGQVTVFDSGGMSLWLGLQTLRASQMVAEGYNTAATLHTLEVMREKMRFFFALDSLDHLRRGGRVNIAQYLLGSVLDIKPILTLKDNVIVSAGQTRRLERALVTIQQWLLDEIENPTSCWLGIIHTQAPAQANRVAALMEETLRPSFVLIAETDPTIAIHTGPGAVGVVICPIEAIAAPDA